MIWDLHCHLSGVPGRTPGERIAQLIEYGQRVGVNRYVFFMGMKWSLNPTPDDMRQQNDDVLQALSHWQGRAFGFVYLNPNYVAESLAELERCVADGPMVGVKLWVARRCRDEDVDAIIRRAHELKAVIYQHTWYKAGGNLPGESSPDDLVKLARRNPDVPLICGHTGGEWESGIRAVRSEPNIVIGTGGFDATAGITEMAVRELGAERVLYGSDAGGRGFGSQLGKILGAEITPTQQQLILGGNLRRMLTPILTAKGIRP